MSFKLTIDAEEEALSLKVSGFDTKGRALIQARLAEVAELLEEILSSDEAANRLTDAELTRLEPSLAALELKYKILCTRLVSWRRPLKASPKAMRQFLSTGFRSWMMPEQRTATVHFGANRIATGFIECISNHLGKVLLSTSTKAITRHEYVEHFRATMTASDKLGLLQGLLSLF